MQKHLDVKGISYGRLAATYSIVARDPETYEMGIGVQTHQMGVGRLVPWLLPGVGAIATQSLINVSFGPAGLEMMRSGVSAPSVVAALVASDPEESRRQVAVVDAHGLAAAHTGRKCIREAAHYVGDGYCVQANMMTNDTVISAMINAYETTEGDLVNRIMATLRAAQEEDGDIRGMQSAALKIVAGRADVPYWQTSYDLRVDENKDPLVELERLVNIRRAQLVDQEGHHLLETGDVQGALQKWKDARAMAPDQVELGFWQAVALADSNPDVQSVSFAARILAASIDDSERREHWLDLIRRVDESNLIAREGAAQELLEAYENQ